MEYLFPNSSISGIFLAMLLLFLTPVLRSDNRFIIRFGSFVCYALLLLLLICSGSRSGWIGYLSGLYFLTGRKSFVHRWIFSIFRTGGFFMFCIFLVVFYKSNSTAGRVHIYKISLQMLVDNWAKGVGFGKFKAHFNEYQALYFSSHPVNNKRALLADNTFYAFNDYLQWFIETGVTGFVVLWVFLYLVFVRIKTIQRLEKNHILLNSAIASLTGIGTAALFSYPLQSCPIQLFTILCVAILFFYPATNKNSLVKAGSVLIQLILPVLFGLSALALSNHLLSKRKEKEAFDLIRSGKKTAATSLYKELTTRFPEKGYYWFLYARQLYLINQIQASYYALKTGMIHYIDNDMYILKGDIEQELGKPADAEISYLKAVYMVPAKIKSRVKLLNFYIQQKDTANAMRWATFILKMPVKIPSERSSALLEETRRTLEKLKRGY